MGERDIGVMGRVIGYVVGKYILTILDQICSVVHVIQGINVHVNNVVSQIVEEVEAARRLCTVEVRAPEVRREPAEQVTEGHLVVDDLRLLEGAVNLSKVLVRPRMAPDLMACAVNPLQDCRPWCRGVVYAAFPPAVADNEEGGRHVVRLQHIKQLGRVDPWPIIECKRDSSLNHAVTDEGAYLNIVSYRGSCTRQKGRINHRAHFQRGVVEHLQCSALEDESCSPSR